MDPLIWAELCPPPPGLLASLWSARAPLAMAGTHQLRSTCPLILPAGQSGFIHMAAARFQQSGSMEGLLSSGVNWIVVTLTSLYRQKQAQIPEEGK